MFPIQRAPSRKVYGEFYGQRQGAERHTAPPRQPRGLLAGDSWRQPSSGRATGESLRCVGLVMQFHAVETGHLPSHSANAVGG